MFYESTKMEGWSDFESNVINYFICLYIELGDKLIRLHLGIMLDLASYVSIVSIFTILGQTGTWHHLFYLVRIV